MFQKTHMKCPRLLVALLGPGLFACTAVSAQEVLHVYGSEGPAPAIQEAAVAFGDGSNVTVKVTTGPPEHWLAQAEGDADVVFASASFMMADFVAATNLQIDEASITPLYTRPSAVLVRPGNPKNIQDFPDLLKPGVRIMVVTGSGQTGLWEDMAGRQGDIRTIRSFRKNIALFAANSTEAMRLWGERPDIDAYVTWNIWHMPLRDRAELINVSDEYRIYRPCSVARTARGKAKPAATRFLEFLSSPQGAEIFESWYWLRIPNKPQPLTVRRDIAIVCRIDSDDWKEGVGSGLAHVRHLVEAYGSIGMPPNELHVSAVVHGDAAYWMLTDTAYNTFTKGKKPNPNIAMIRELTQLGVSVELCGESMKDHGWTQEDILPNVKIVPNAYPRIVDLEMQGYAYIRF
jgi:accessory colonization factor AcfC